MTTWSLLVDETGNFENAREAVAVVGVLARSDALPPPAILRKRLSAALPWAPWPFHAAHLMRPAFYLLSCEVHAKGGGVLEAETIAGLQELVAGGGEMLKDCRDRIAAGRRPRISDLIILEQRLLPARCGRLKDFLESEYWRVVSVLKHIRRSLRTASFPPLSLVVSVERDPANETFGSDSPVQRATSRYLALLQALQALTADVLDDIEGKPHRIELRVMERHVMSPGQQTGVPLSFGHISMVSSARERARVVPMEIARFGPAVSPALVLADLVALRVRWNLLSGRNGQLCAVEAQIEHRVSLPVRSFATHIASVAVAPAPDGGGWRAEAHAEWVRIRAARDEPDK